MKNATPRIRRQPIPADAVFVVRGDEDTDRLAEAAWFFLRRFPAWGRYGLSVYHADGDAEIDLLCRVELVRFSLIVVLSRPGRRRADEAELWSASIERWTLAGARGIGGRRRRGGTSRAG